MKKNIVYMSLLAIFGLIMNGCASSDVKPKQCSAYSSEIGEKCILSTVPLTGVVEHVDCSIDKKCKLLISDEIGRKFTLENMDQLKIGDTVEIHITKLKI